MSLYAFGKIVTDSTEGLMRPILEAADRASAVVVVDRLDEEDVAAMEAFNRVLRGSGLTFRLVSGPGEVDATRLWIEASRLVTTAPLAGRVGAFRGSRLGMLCDVVLGLGNVAGIALVDGGIETEFVGDLAECLACLAGDVELPWDRAPNRLYVRS